MTIETTYSQAREQLKSLMDRVVNDREVIVVRRRSGGDAAMIAANEPGNRPSAALGQERRALVDGSDACAHRITARDAC